MILARTVFLKVGLFPQKDRDLGWCRQVSGQ